MKNGAVFLFLIFIPSLFFSPNTMRWDRARQESLGRVAWCGVLKPKQSEEVSTQEAPVWEGPAWREKGGRTYGCLILECQSPSRVRRSSEGKAWCWVLEPSKVRRTPCRWVVRSGA